MEYNIEDDYKLGIQYLQKNIPDVVDAYHELTGLCFEEGQISKKHKELMALGISLSHRDENCVRYHVTEALHKGASEQEIWETVNVAIAMSGGMIVSQSAHWVKDTINGHQVKQ
ncbi:carboxymuconolactone decarboxylase family protein [Ammoniphilus resinae]|uniref:AhpD family alkylhydroperoxidase n=1 Tax=Ammoniphilus resinae TaxID=861532 RepID=A0ABS4GWC2_9BACL|nr:carboxymuconolactone decarboxylase family protein [Ammoniphilus resinae]MBP1934327.1 AhpD family alkylhydroperoxidase [Ammoniphilus resinae]